MSTSTLDTKDVPSVEEQKRREERLKAAMGVYGD